MSWRSRRGFLRDRRAPGTHRALTSAEHQQALLDAGLDEGTAGFVAALDANIGDGLLAVTPRDLAAVLGRPTVPMETTVADWGA